MAPQYISGDERIAQSLSESNSVDKEYVELKKEMQQRKLEVWNKKEVEDARETG